MYDIFISYASEDRDKARPLAEILRALGASVWFDEFELKLGDNLRRRIDDGLSKCRFGVVLLSHAFFAKHYTNQELDGLAQRETGGQKVILPIWMDVKVDDVRQYSPTLAGRIAGKWDEGVNTVAFNILAEARPDLLEKLIDIHVQSEIPRIRTGQELAAVFASSYGHYSFNDSLESQEDVDLVAGFIQEVSDWSDIWDDIEIGNRVEAEFKLTGRIRDLEAYGWVVYGKSIITDFSVKGEKEDWPAYVLAVLRGEAVSVSFRGKKLLVMRKDESADFVAPSV